MSINPDLFLTMDRARQRELIAEARTQRMALAIRRARRAAAAKAGD